MKDCDGILVSVIVPVYNVEMYLERCVNSIIKQTYHNLDIILVDDGSKDSSGMLCEQFKQQDERIRVIHKKNEGAGYARNTGIENAHGEYVCFVDSDDWIEQDLVEKTLQVATTENADLICYGYYCDDSLGNIVGSMSPTVSLVCYKNEDVQNVFLPDYVGAGKQSKIKPEMNKACLIKMRIIDENHWRFMSEREIFSEDVYSLLDLCKYVNVVCVMPEVFYHYCYNGTSLTHTYREDSFGKIVDFYKKCIHLCEIHNYSGEVKERIKKPFLDFTVAVMKQIVGSDASKIEKREALTMICSNEVLQDVLCSKPSGFMNWKTRLLWGVVQLKQVQLLQFMISVQIQVIRND